ncbi:MAG: hypothetical protein EOP36_08185 [Rubrivivax sp.]|nr:MAG: hypothetical protein EOP36_08185 [Rubrivivax sp.]
MSYILDALRRADSERERGAVPSIHAPPAPPVADDPPPPSRQPQVLVAVIVVLLLALAGLLAWHWMGGKETPPQPVAAAAPMVDGSPAPSVQVQAPAQPVQQTPPPAPASVQTPAPVLVQPPAAISPPPVTAAPAPPVRQAQPAPSPSLATAPPVVTVPARPAATPSPTTATAPAPQAQADTTRVHAVNELPAHIQRDLPKLVVGGAMYSDTPANRMLIINSQVFHEGDKLSPDLLLQEIKLKSAVFQYKGYRYGVSY